VPVHLDDYRDVLGRAAEVLGRHRLGADRVPLAAWDALGAVHRDEVVVALRAVHLPGAGAGRSAGRELVYRVRDGFPSGELAGPAAELQVLHFAEPAAVGPELGTQVSDPFAERSCAVRASAGAAQSELLGAVSEVTVELAAELVWSKPPVRNLAPEAESPASAQEEQPVLSQPVQS